MPMRDILGQATIEVAQHVGAPMPIALGRKPSRGAQAPRTQLKESLFALCLKVIHAAMKNCVWQRLVATQQHQVVAIVAIGAAPSCRWRAIIALR
jgi:hypothetical protein